MKVDVVVDVGNTRIKWGRCANNAVTAVVSLSPDDFREWDRQFMDWSLTESLSWALASVHPGRQDRFLEWLKAHRQRVLVIAKHEQLPLRVLVKKPDSVGIDRLLNAVAANERRQGRAAIIADAGSAVTVDLVDETGAFRGGVIFPGLRLMAQALHDHTALLPFVEVRKAPPPLGTTTVAAIESGIYYAVASAINMQIRLLNSDSGPSSAVFLTGGDALTLQEAVEPTALLWPEMTLEGIRLSAEALP
jgi:type III pantothenate kinase